MSTHDLNIANANGSSFRTDLNNALLALGTLMSAATAPGLTPTTGQAWLDTTTGTYALKIHNGTSYVTVLTLTSGGSPVVTPGGVGSTVQGYDVDTAKTDVVQSWSKQQHFNATQAAANLTDGATINWNLDDAQIASVTIAGNRSLAAPTNMKNGGTYILRVKQNGTGGNTMSWNAVYKFIGAVSPTISSAANALDIFTFVSDGTNMYCVGERQGF